MSAPDILIAIVNYGTPDLTCQCLASLALARPTSPSFRVVVADNASPDNSLEVIGGAIAAHGWSHWASLLPLPVNGGFACGNNAILAPALADRDVPKYVLLLNSDTIVSPGALATLASYLDDHPEAGIAGSRLEFPDATPQLSAFGFPSAVSEFEGAAETAMLSRLLGRPVPTAKASDLACRCDWLAGASMLIRSEVCHQIGLLDDRYFMYFEETDFCLRAARKGWACHYVPQSRIVHLVGASSGPGYDGKRAAIWFQSRRHYFLKNHGLMYAALADVAMIAGLLVKAIKQRALRRTRVTPRIRLADLFRHSVLLHYRARSMSR